MVLTDRQRADLHAGIYEYLCSRPGEGFAQAAAALLQADPEACTSGNNNNNRNGEHRKNAAASALPLSSPSSSSFSSQTPLLEKKWTAIPRLQKKVLELERVIAQSAKIHAHRNNTTPGAGVNTADTSGGLTTRRMLPRLPVTHKLQGHSMGVTSVALHPVFTIVVSGSEDGTIKVWDHESGEYMRTLKGHTNTVNSVAFTPKGLHLASCSTDLSIKLWDVTTYTCLRTLRGHDHTISSVRFLPLLESNHNHNNSPTSSTVTVTTTTGMDIAVSGCKYLLSASRDQTVKVWDIETGFCDQTLYDHSDWVRCLAVRNSDGAVWASSGNDQTIYVYDNQHNKINELRGHEHVVESLAFLCEAPLSANNSQLSRVGSSASGGGSTKSQLEPARDYLASGSRDRTVRLWNITEATCLATFKSHENWVRSVVIHTSGNYIISSSDDKTIRVFDIKANRCLRTLDKAHDHFVTSLDIHPTLPILVSGGVDQTVRCWQLD